MQPSSSARRRCQGAATGDQAGILGQAVGRRSTIERWPTPPNACRTQVGACIGGRARNQPPGRAPAPVCPPDRPAGASTSGTRQPPKDRMATLRGDGDPAEHGLPELRADWTEQDLDQVEADRSPRTHAQAFPWVAGAAQIPAIIGTPLVGLLVLRPEYQLGFIFAYIVAIGLGITLFVHFLRKVDIYRYKDKGRHWLGYQISPSHWEDLGGTFLPSLWCVLLSSRYPFFGSPLPVV
jgi:hypothetical protein